MTTGYYYSLNKDDLYHRLSGIGIVTSYRLNEGLIVISQKWNQNRLPPLIKESSVVLSNK